MELTGVFFEKCGVHATWIESSFSVPWTERAILELFADSLSRTEMRKEDQQFWQTAEYYEGAKRSNAGLRHLTAAMLDCDCADPGAMDEVLAALRAQGLAHFAYTSWSHQSPEKLHKDTGRRGPFDCFRLVLPYSRPVLPDEHRSVVPGLWGHELPDWERYQSEVRNRSVPLKDGRHRRAKPRGWDPVSSRPSQGYFVPCPHSEVDVFQGRPLDVEEVLSRRTTPRVTSRAQRPYVQPLAHAQVALERVDAALRETTGAWLGPPNPDGWCRAPCPSCAPEGEQRSPSFTTRANGDSVEMRCHAGCSHADISSALALSGEVYEPPEYLRAKLDEQLERQKVHAQDLPVDEAVVLLERDLRAALDTKTPTILRYPAGTGKAQPNTEPVLLERGWVPMGEVLVGDKVFGSDGRLSEVVATHPQGLRRVLRVSFSDGTSVRCDEGHLWRVRNQHGTWKTLRASQMMRMPLKVRSGKWEKHTLQVPLVAPIQRPEADLPVDPYVLGLLLGDGCMTQERVAPSFVSEDKELLEELAERLPAGVFCVKREPGGQGRATTVGLSTATSFGGAGRNLLTKALRELGLLGRGSWDKYIPREYLHASVSQRLELLQGLMDTDGSALPTAADYLTASESLAAGVRELVESLGGTCKLYEKEMEYKGEVRRYQRAYLRLPFGMCPFRLERKVETYTAGAGQRPPSRKIVSIEPDGEEECTCITVSASDSLYVTRHHVLTHNSFASAKVLAERARQGRRIVYSTQEHVVAHETRMLLPPDVRGRSVHIHSPLIQVGNGPVCARADELRERVFEYGTSLQGSVCPRCPQRTSCEALAEAQQRTRDLPEARVVFVSHAGIRQVFGVDADGNDRGAGLELIVDEMPSTFECVTVTRQQLQQLAQVHGGVLPSADFVGVALVRELASAWVEGREPGEVTWKGSQEGLGSALALAADRGRVRVREGAAPRPEERVWLRAADAVIRLGAALHDGFKIYGLDPQYPDDLVAYLPDAAHQALVRTQGVLLSATPLLHSLPGFTLKDVRVADGAEVRRKLVLRPERGSGALTESYLNPETGWRERAEPEPGDPPGVNWPVVEEAIARALREAEQYDPPRALFVSFKAVIDAVRARGKWPQLELAHFGALRGKNDWKEGAERECSVVYCLGEPRFNLLPTLRQLGLHQQAAEQAWADCAAGELTQAEGRLRLPRRTKPCTVFVEGSIAPLDWHTENTQVVADPSREWSREDFAAWLWGPDVQGDFEKLASPGIGVVLGQMCRHSPLKKAALWEGLCWTPGEE